MTQKADEHLMTYKYRLVNMANLAYDDHFHTPEIQQNLVTIFCLGLRNSATAQSVLRASPVTVDEAVRMARHHNSCQEIVRERQQHVANHADEDHNIPPTLNTAYGSQLKELSGLIDTMKSTLVSQQKNNAAHTSRNTSYHGHYDDCHEKCDMRDETQERISYVRSKREFSSERRSSNLNSSMRSRDYHGRSPPRRGSNEGYYGSYDSDSSVTGHYDKRHCRASRLSDVSRERPRSSKCSLQSLSRTSDLDQRAYDINKREKRRRHHEASARSHKRSRSPPRRRRPSDRYIQEQMVPQSTHERSCSPPRVMTIWEHVSHFDHGLRTDYENLHHHNQVVSERLVSEN